MMILWMNVVLFSLMIGLTSFVLNVNHLLNSLLSLEFLSVNVYWWLSGVIFLTEGDFYFILFYLVMVVSEGVLGLSLLIMSAYSHGSEKMKIYSSLMC
uniref:ND4L n=1 Tax=Pandorites podoceroides TaxID=1842081 RepID=A0A9N6YJK2_9CRUS|nr:TPA_asm: ND4L [Pandorites podoceroides]